MNGSTIPAAEMASALVPMRRKPSVFSSSPIANM
jgi:hypothetical protein